MPTQQRLFEVIDLDGGGTLSVDEVRQFVGSVASRGLIADLLGQQLDQEALGAHLRFFESAQMDVGPKLFRYLFWRGEFRQEDGAVRFERERHSAVNGGGTGDGGVSTDDGDLPPGWASRRDAATSKVYYYKTDGSGLTSWDRDQAWEMEQGV